MKHVDVSNFCQECFQFRCPWRRARRSTLVVGVALPGVGGLDDVQDAEHAGELERFGPGQPDGAGAVRVVGVAPKGAQTGFALFLGADFEKQTVGGPAPATLTSPDVRALHTELTAKGVDVTEPAVEPWSTWVQITDPDGWEFVVGETD